MELIENLEHIQAPYRNAVVTIGNFDGVHLGHRALFNAVNEKARQINGTSIAVTFEPHPIRVLKQNGQPPLLTVYEQKVELIEKAGLDVLVCIPFTLEFAEMSARSFVADLLVKQIGMKAVIVGKDYTFGKNREGNLDLLKTYGEELQFDVIALDKVKLSKDMPERISSTLIRELIHAGKVGQARTLLGRYYQVRGVVIPGRDRGARVLGIPTANIRLIDELCPKTGIYAVTVKNEGSLYNGVANIGYSPTFDDHEFTVEVHLLDFEQNIYNRKIRVNFIKRIRGEKKFSDISELKQEIQNDIIKSREILAKII